MPKQIIKGRAIVADDWNLVRAEEGADADTVSALSVPAGRVILPLQTWLARREALSPRAAAGEIAVWLAPDEDPVALREDLPRLALVAIDFPKFTDGRGYSHAWNLRSRLGWTGELRAIGDVLRDQLFSMQRVGFDAYDTRPDRSIEDALLGLTVFSETYQASVDQRVPLFRRHARPSPATGA
ncbi:DUF934 domain-containing protein [Pseudoduganella violaceinigra]|uniref:DUF934 domain-containing protein n=1 Tax=Pseudoduganella violaceinigra TaxID=246602 RepID=UPI00041A0B77|nr:DUF934 domain-containing protein [Pseudoduganella violaceinigra]